MERAGKKTRDIQFFSEKNGGMVCLHSPAARDYAKYLVAFIPVILVRCRAAFPVGAQSRIDA